MSLLLSFILILVAFWLGFTVAILLAASGHSDSLIEREIEKQKTNEVD